MRKTFVARELIRYAILDHGSLDKSLCFDFDDLCRSPYTLLGITIVFFLQGYDYTYISTVTLMGKEYHVPASQLMTAALAVPSLAE